MNFFLYAAITSLVLLSLATMAYIYSFQKNNPLYGKIALGLVFGSSIVLTLQILHSLQMDNGLASSAILLSCCLGWITIIGHVKFDMKLSGILTLPISILVLLVDLFDGTSLEQVSRGPSVIFRDMHILTAILGQTAAIGAFVTSLMYLWQHRNLKKKNFDLISNQVPALDRLSSVLNLTLWLGLTLFSVALISGAYYSARSDLTMGLGPKVIWAISVWSWYLAILIVRNVFKKSEILAARLSLFGFFILALSLFGILFSPTNGG